MLHKLASMEQLLKKMHCKYLYRSTCFYTRQMLNFRAVSRTPAISKLEPFAA